MVGAGPEALHGIVAQAGAQAFAQLFPGQRLLRAFVEQLAVLGSEGRQLAGDQAQRLYRCRQLQMLQAAAGQLEEHGGFALGGEQADR